MRSFYIKIVKSLQDNDFQKLNNLCSGSQINFPVRALNCLSNSSQAFGADFNHKIDLELLLKTYKDTQDQLVLRSGEFSDLNSSFKKMDSKMRSNF